MASNNHKEEPSTAPKPDRWYDLTLGSSFKDPHPSSKFCTLRYEFKPASIDKNQPGALHKSKDNRVTVEFNNNQQGKPKVVFEGSSEDYKENDAVLFFDGESFRLERLHRAVKRLRHVRVPGESAGPAPIAGGAGPPVEISSPPLAKASKYQSANRSSVSAIPAVQVEVERIEIGDFKSSDEKPRNEKVPNDPFARVPSPNESSEIQIDDLEEQLDILNDDDDDGGIAAPTGTGGNIDVKEFDTGIDINIPQNDTDDEIADVDVSDDDEADKGRNAADALREQALREQVNAQERENHTSSSSSTTGSTSSGSGSGSSSSDSDSSDGDSVNSI